MQCEDNFGWLGGNLRCQLQKFLCFFDAYRVVSTLGRIGQNVSDTVYPKKLHILNGKRKRDELRRREKPRGISILYSYASEKLRKNTKKSDSNIETSNSNHRKKYESQNDHPISFT